jgi:MFS transporter, PAT family, beta-lactamase induction signal transducer AmpG
MSQKTRNPWCWVPSLYLYEGIPYSIIMTTSGLIYKTMGIPVSKLALWTSLLYVPWTFKFVWSPYVEMVSTKRNWIIITQLLLGIAFIVAGAAMPLTWFFPATIGLFALSAILSASHDIAADGFYMHALDFHSQTFFVGIRTTFYRVAMLTAMGAIPLVAGIVQERTGLEPVSVRVHATVTGKVHTPLSATGLLKSGSGEPQIIVEPNVIEMPLYRKGISETDTACAYISLSAPPASGDNIVLNIDSKSGTRDIKPEGNTRFEFTNANWNKPVQVKFKVNHNLSKSSSAVFRITAGNMAFSWTVALGVLGIFLLLLGLYHKIILPQPEISKKAETISLRVYADVFISFFRKPGIVPALLFFLLYRLGEAQSMKIVTPFLADSRIGGGIGMTTAQYGIAYGTIGMIALMTGGILGGVLASRWGLKRLIWLMAISMNLPNLGFFYMAQIQPLPDSWMVYAGIILEQFGYGFGFTAYTLYMLYFVSDSKYKTSEYAIGTSLMALGMMLPGMISGYMQEFLGYQHFFIYVLLCTLPGMAIIPFLKIDTAFGIRKKQLK